MKKIFKIMFTFFLILNSGNLFSQTENEKISVKMSKVTENIYKFSYSYYSLNTVAVTGPDGILLVDSGIEETEGLLKTKLSGISDKNVIYIINTHYHGDHTGGNLLSGKNGTIIGHKSMRENLFRDFKEEKKDINSPECRKILPEICIEDQTSLYFNGEEIRIIPFLTSHTECDIIVHFTDSKIVCLGDLLFSGTFPFIHITRGGNAVNYVKTLEKILKILPPDVRIIAGHGEDYTITELKNYYDMAKNTVNVVRSAKEKGKSLQELIDGNVLNKWDSWSSDTSQYRNKKFWIETIYESK